MQAGELAPGIQEWRLHVEVNGVARVAESVSIDADVASDLPDQVAGVSGVSARTGTIRWAPQNPVSARPATPWTREGAWPPQPGDEVGIWAGDADTSWKVFTGRIDTSEGGVGSFSSKIVDSTDQLDRPISLDPVAWQMPGYYDEATDSGFAPVRTFVQPWHAAYRAMRACGFGLAAPTQVGGSVILDADFQGSIWPTVGTVRNPTVSVDNEFAWGDGFTYISQGSVTYTPRQVVIGAGQALRVWGRFAAVPTTEKATNIWGYTGGHFIRTQASLTSAMSTLTVTVEHFDGDPNGSGQLLGSGTATVPAVITEGSVWWEVMIPAGSATAYLVTEELGGTVPNGTVEQAVGFGVAAPSGQAVMLSGHGLGPMIAARMGVLTPAQWRAMSSQTSPGRVRAWGRGLVNSQYVSRTQIKRNARDLLAEIGEATLTAMWIDELGTMQWAPTNIMYTGTPVRTFTTEQDIFELGWIESLQATRHRVYAAFEGVALKLAEDGYTKTLWTPGRGEDITPGTTEEFIDVPRDQEWFGVDTSLWRVSSVLDRFNARKGSFYAAVQESANDTYTVVGSGYAATLERVTPTTWKLTHSNSTGTTVQAMTNPDSTAIRRTLRGFGMPIIRGQGVADFIDMEVTGSTTGPGWAPDMRLDLRAWAIEGHAQAVTDWLSARLSRPLVTLTDVEVAYDPRVQLGDIVTISSVALLGMSVNAVVVGKAERHGAGASMSLKVRVIGTRTQHATYAEFEAAYTGQQYSALESAWADATYVGFENAPLGRI